MNPRQRYAGITASPNTQEERDRIDAQARRADEAWEKDRAASGRMTFEKACEIAAARGLRARMSHRCGRSKTRRAIGIRTSCELYKFRRYTIPGIGSGDCLEDGIHANTWEQAFRMRDCRDVLQKNERKAKAVRT